MTEAGDDLSIPREADFAVIFPCERSRRPEAMDIPRLAPAYNSPSRTH